MRRVERQSKTLQRLQQHCSRAVRSRQAVCIKRTQSQSRGSGFAPKDRCAIRKKHFWVLFLLWKKVPPVPLLWKAGTKLLLFQEEGRLFLFQGKEKSMFLLYCDKRNQKHRKGKGDPLPFSIPSPLTTTDKANFLVYAGIAETARQIGNKKR